MVANTIIITAEFSFKGETYKPTLTLDLDTLMQQHNAIPALYPLLAEQNNIDNYSYEYEVLESTEIAFSEPTGLAKSCFVNNTFDMEAYGQLWQQQQILVQLKPLLKSQLNIDDIEQHPALRSVLLAACQLTKKQHIINSFE